MWREKDETGGSVKARQAQEGRVKHEITHEGLKMMIRKINTGKTQ